MANPVQIEIETPRHFDRVQVGARVVLAIVIGWFAITFGALGAFASLLLPILAALAISSVGSESYVADPGHQLWRVLDGLLRCEAYMMMLIDRLPLGDEPGISIAITYSGRPTFRSAMWRVVASIPLVFVMFVLAIPSGILWFVATLWVLVRRVMPHSIRAFQLGVLRWQAQLLAYQASLVAPYPRWSFDARSNGLSEAHEPIRRVSS